MDVKSNALCNTCNEVVTDIKCHYQRHYNSEFCDQSRDIQIDIRMIKDRIQAAANGCILCREVVNAYKVYYERNPDQEEERHGLKVDLMVGWGFIYLSLDIEESEQTTKLVMFMPKKDLDIKVGRTSAVVEPPSDFGASVAYPQQRVSDCILYHPECGSTSAGSEYFLPTRLLDLGNDSLAMRDDIRLVESGTINCAGGPEPYPLLSHCCGPPRLGNEPLKTTKTNLEQHKKGISFNNDLPKTFRDAVQLARAMSVQYLWIDSLCII
ncbi:hypothetical protein QBC38DRAFT_522721 [Podospora fimiseda]|uniref:Heterokaryon incompatibility domain-containing protein n=1 Tax=Podospora fimiseda TaxID=252190 RepID=A0AAN7BF96_9PEZI|nr:hypothetical protein QBC38DRAFT_522721 [Podospora fimiseda]